MRWHVLFVPAVILLLSACHDAVRLTGPSPDDTAPAFAISDAAHGGTPGFYFLPPLVAAPRSTGTFDPALSPVVRICALAAGACSGADIAVLTTDGRGPAAIKVDPRDGKYHAVWHTREAALDPGTHYRVRVYVSELQLGYLDLEIVETGKGRKRVAAGMVALQRNTPLVLSFRIETGIVGQVIVEPAAAAIPVDGTQRFTATLKDLHGGTLAGRPVTWSSSDTRIATVDASGLAFGVRAGAAAIIATSGGASGSAPLVVETVRQWITEVEGGDVDYMLQGIWGSGPNNVYVVGWKFGPLRGVLRRYDGTAWSPGIGEISGRGIWGSDPVDVFTVGGLNGSSIRRYDEPAWGHVMIPGADLNAIWGSAVWNVFAVGDFGDIVHFDGLTWLRMASPTTDDLYAVWGAGHDLVFAAGHNWNLRYDGTTWSIFPSVMETNAIWGTSGTNVFFVGNGGTVMHHHGGELYPYLNHFPLVPTTANLNAVWGSGPNNVFVVGQAGTILHFDGADWTLMASPTTEDLVGVWGSSGSDVVIVGRNGAILRGAP